MISIVGTGRDAGPYQYPVIHTRDKREKFWH
jgi:hypothetical protein